MNGLVLWCCFVSVLCQSTGGLIDVVRSLLHKQTIRFLNQQTHRVHDTIDVNFLKRVKNKNRDSTYKAEVWDVSQNVDRQAFPADGLTSCLTPRYRVFCLLCTIVRCFVFEFAFPSNPVSFLNMPAMFFSQTYVVGLTFSFLFFFFLFPTTMSSCNLLV